MQRGTPDMIVPHADLMLSYLKHPEQWLQQGALILMDLERSQALKITVKDIGGAEHLFIECGGFGPKNPAGWQSPLMVLKRAGD